MEENKNAFINRNFTVEVLIAPSGIKTYIVREHYVQAPPAVVTLGSYKELCQYFDSF